MKHNFWFLDLMCFLRMFGSSLFWQNPNFFSPQLLHTSNRHPWSTHFWPKWLCSGRDSSSSFSSWRWLQGRDARRKMKLYCRFLATGKTAVPIWLGCFTSGSSFCFLHEGRVSNTPMQHLLPGSERWDKSYQQTVLLTLWCLEFWDNPKMDFSWTFQI